MMESPNFKLEGDTDFGILRLWSSYQSNMVATQYCAPRALYRAANPDLKSGYGIF